MGEHGFQRLRVLAAVAFAAADAAADHQRDFGRSTGHIVPLGSLVGYLVGRHQGEVHIHQFGDRTVAGHRHTDGGTADTGFGDRGIEHPVAAERFQQSLGELERAAVISDVFAEQDYAFVAQHFFNDAFLDSVAVVDLAVGVALDHRNRLECLGFGIFGRNHIAGGVGIHIFDNIFRVGIG